MSPDALALPDFAVLAAVFAAGIGMLLGGAANLLLGRSRPTVRVAAGAAACAVAGVSAWLVAGFDRAGWVAAGGAAVGQLVVGFGPALAAALTRRPGARWGGLAVSGLTVAVGAVVWFEYRTEVVAERAAEELSFLTEKPATRPVAAHVATDRGTVVVVMEATDPRARAEMALLEGRFLDSETVRNRVIRRQPADDRTNCHGWVFTGGRYWISGAEVDHILADNEYHAVATPQPGDLVVYRSGATVAHSAVVRYVTPGMPVLVEGKWGTTGVYLHDVATSVYGSEYTFYRAARATHVLAGLDTPPVVAGGQ